MTSFEPGVRVGPYQILALAGAGGMGEVYRARDTRLDREVAIKVLPGHLSSDANLRERFEREARAISSLTHPHIATLYDVGHHDGADYLVMEFLSGETLADRVARGPLPLRDALRFGAQIADALDNAHKQGIIHRDLKPGNVMLTKSGAKVLDFGLAKYAGKPSDGLDEPTVHRPLTEEGTLLGTVQYMAPEQLEGREADARTDIFALGALLYEMTTGRRAFEGTSRASLIAAIMQSDPPAVSAVQPVTPPALDRLVRSCLEKDPDERLQSAHDVARELRWISEAGSQPEAGHPVLRRNMSWFILAAFLAGIVATFFLLRQRFVPEARTVNFTMAPPELLAVTDSEYSGIAVSPDGRLIAFIGSRGDRPMLFVRALDGFNTRAIPQTEGATAPFWSPDSRTVGFFADGKLKKIGLDGGAPQTLADAPLGRGASWSKDGIILFSPDLRAPLYRVSSEGGTVAAATRLNGVEKEVAHRWPIFLPNGRDFLYHAIGKNRGLHLSSLDSQSAKFIVDGSNAAYLDRGILLFVSDRALVAQPFDAKAGKLTGSAVTIAGDVGRYREAGPTGFSPFSASPGGVIAYRPIELDVTQLTWLDMQGKAIRRVGPRGTYLEPSLSPDGFKLVVTRAAEERSDLWTVDLTRGTFSRVTYGEGENALGIWSPDGKRIAFTSDRAGSYDLYDKLANGSGPETLLHQSALTKFADDWSPDGRHLVFEEFNPKTKIDLWVLRLSDRKPIPFLVTPFDETHAQFSRDNGYIAYSSNESGSAEVYVQPFPTTGQKWQISTAGGDQAVWGRDGKSIFYLAPGNRFMKVTLDLERGIEPSDPKELFTAGIPPSNMLSHRNMYAVSQDGKQVLILEKTASGTSPIHVIVNWKTDADRLPDGW